LGTSEPCHPLNGGMGVKTKTAIAGGLVGARGIEPPNLMCVIHAL
jgi:hypothetical protein